jgi:hypothetical protein
MKSFVRHIGIIDLKNQVHSVRFESGLNVVTGKSSTGKSALIEIFDYCFGSSDLTIPQGVIANHAEIYFTVMRVKDSTVILARKATEKLKRKAFVTETTDEAVFNDVHQLSLEYFDEKEFQPLDDFKKEVGRKFGLVFTDVDVDPEARSRRWKNAHAPSPSIRSFTSFMLQHQNLIANKHAIFYRFDEKEKREQAIEHFKCFMGFAKPEYFQLRQELTEWENELKKLENQFTREQTKKADLVRRIQIALDNYSAASGTRLGVGSAEELLKDPERSLGQVINKPVQVAGISEESANRRKELGEAHAKKVAEKRAEGRQRSLVQDSIRQIEQYRTQAESVPLPDEETVSKSECPFCHHLHSELEVHSNKLDEAIGWLNDELEKSFTLPKSLVEDEKRISDRIDLLNAEIKDLEERLKTLNLQDAELAKSRPQYESALKAKVQVEVVLETIAQDRPVEIQQEIDQLKERIKARKELLNQEHDVEREMRGAESSINRFMAEWGPKFEFEKSFNPINLRFSLASYELWHQNPEGTKPEKVFLRAMGSGANWLYSHLTLFFALHYYFCHRGSECLIPPVLFLDQPSQVYFPSVLDTAATFEPGKIGSADPTRPNNRTVDADILAVENMYSLLLEFCDATKKATGIEPQIIVTDHADKLAIRGARPFESFVRARWRTRGMIEPVESAPAK